MSLTLRELELALRDDGIVDLQIRGLFGTHWAVRAVHALGRNAAAMETDLEIAILRAIDLAKER